MDVVALIIAGVAIVVFLFVADVAFGNRRLSGIALGLALLTAAWICQLVDVVGSKVHV